MLMIIVIIVAMMMMMIIIIVAMVKKTLTATSVSLHLPELTTPKLPRPISFKSRISSLHKKFLNFQNCKICQCFATIELGYYKLIMFVECQHCHEIFKSAWVLVGFLPVNQPKVFLNLLPNVFGKPWVNLII